jgi:LuxR family maltose regulon positive regulatory protein
VEPLSPREVIVLRYLCSRLTYREIAAALYISLNTLKTQVRSVYRKLAVDSRAEAVDVGRYRGLI